MSFFKKLFGRELAAQAVYLADAPSEPALPPKVYKARLAPGTVRFMPIFRSGSIGPAHQTFIGAVDSNSRRPVKILRVEIDPLNLAVISAVTLDPFNATETV